MIAFYFGLKINKELSLITRRYDNTCYRSHSVVDVLLTTYDDDDDGDDETLCLQQCFLRG